MTIEQQFVRVALGRYERTLRRKIREQLVAIAVSRWRPKAHIGCAYLALAFYGSGCVGRDGLKKLCGPDLYSATPGMIREAVARLKYPEPVHATSLWRLKHQRRLDYIAKREQWLTTGCRPRIAALRLLLQRDLRAWISRPPSNVNLR